MCRRPAAAGTAAPRSSTAPAIAAPRIPLVNASRAAVARGMGDAFDGDGTVDGAEPGSLERFERVGANIIGTMKDPGSVWRLSMEVLALGYRLPEVRDRLAAAQREAGRGLVPLLMGGREEDVSDETADTLGMFYVTLMTGLIAQWTFDPGTAPDAAQLTAGLRRVIGAAAADGAP
ncbi:TetR family transcriptional regulator [Streptomyces toyocaensis]|uniref:TetR family transcriptional regulator n=1 Tax=Streptomyces toyocaensis TaxID=55952 RepID=A0A081XSG2_STRTO|nr:TetR/AcrR family transcriptional regulator [Streptomyces toyocaensis]KES06485.1 TetR family transcriptional regulator [Streptomyces toyocaensis]